MRNPERLAGETECASVLYSAVVESLCHRHPETMASIKASRGNFAEKCNAFSDTSSLPASRHSVFENLFSHGLLVLTQPFLILLILISISLHRELFEKGLTDLMLDPEPEPNIRFFNIHRLVGRADPRRLSFSVFSRASTKR
jgi:hypothetical protein